MILTFPLFGSSDKFYVQANAIESMTESHHEERMLDDGHSMVRTVPTTRLRTFSGNNVILSLNHDQAMEIWHSALDAGIEFINSLMGKTETKSDS